MAKLLNGTISFVNTSFCLTFKAASREDGRKKAAEKLCLPGSSDEHFRSKNVLRIYVDGKEVFSAKEGLRKERIDEIAQKNGEQPKRSTPPHVILARCRASELTTKTGHRPIAIATLPEEAVLA